jgi:site-specific recombinase XerD
VQVRKKTRDNILNLAALPAPAETVDPWLASLAADDRSTHTIRSYGCSARQFLDWFYAQERRAASLADFTPIALVGYRNALQHHQRKATNSVNVQVAALRAWCAWLHEQGLLPTNPAVRFKSVGRQAPLAPQGLADREVNALLREAQRTRHSTRDYAVLQVLLQTGMRIGECADLTYQDISFGERQGSVTIRGGKGNKARTIPLNGSARKALADYVAPALGVAPTLVAVADAWPRRQPTTSPTPLWRSQKGGRLTTQALRGMIDNLVRACAARELVRADASAHTLRHTFAMHYLQENPGDLIGLATLLGHSSLETTRIYGQPTAEQLATQVDRLNLNAYTG